MFEKNISKDKEKSTTTQEKFKHLNEGEIEKISPSFRKRMKEIFLEAAFYISVSTVLSLPFLVHPKSSSGDLQKVLMN
jgi:hypothetical protein